MNKTEELYKKTMTAIGTTGREFLSKISMFCLLFAIISGVYSCKSLEHKQEYTQFDEITRKNVYIVVEEMPQYKGGEGVFLKELANNVQYVYSENDNLQTRVQVQFVIDKKGQLIGARIYGKESDIMNMLKIIQTIYLMMALVLTIVCLCLPLVTFHEPELGGYAVMNNLWATTPEGVRELSVWPMFAVLLLTCLIDVFAIFHYKKRMFPARLCTINVLLILLWMALCAFYVYTYQTKDVVCHLEMAITHCLPAISLFFYIMALRSVIKAEQKVKAANKNGEVDTITATEV